MGLKLSTLGQCLIASVLVFPVVLYAYQQNQRPPRQEVDQPLFQGIDYQRLVRTDPRPNVLHVVSIDLSTPGLSPIVTAPKISSLPSIDQTPKISILAQTTGEFVESSGVQLGINGNYFYDFREKTPWDFYPRSGNPVYAVGEAIGNNHRYGSPKEGWPALCFLPALTVPIGFTFSQSASPSAKAPTYHAHIAATGQCPPHTKEAIAGRDLLVDNGQPLPSFPNITNDKPYSRAAVGIDASGQKLWLVIIDGKQPEYSEGVLLNEMAQIFVELDVEKAIALDGGGSSTLVINPGLGPQLLNTPMHAKWPKQERAIVNHLGFYALPLNPIDSPSN